MVPFGSRLPLVVFDSPSFRRASVYVLDVNPVAARPQRQALAVAHGGGSRGPRKTGAKAMAVAGRVDRVLRDVVDPECARFPFAAYRFELPYTPQDWRVGHVIQSVVMSMTGFTVKVSIEHNDTYRRRPPECPP